MRLLRWLGCVPHFRKPFQLGSQDRGGCGPGLGISDAHLFFFNSIGILAVKIENGFGRLGPFLWLVLQQIAKMPTPPVELKKASYFKH
jgi:hypothetical protein